MQQGVDEGGPYPRSSPGDGRAGDRGERVDPGDVIRFAVAAVAKWRPMEERRPSQVVKVPNPTISATRVARASDLRGLNDRLGRRGRGLGSRERLLQPLVLLLGDLVPFG